MARRQRTMLPPFLDSPRRTIRCRRCPSAGLSRRTPTRSAVTRRGTIQDTASLSGHRTRHHMRALLQRPTVRADKVTRRT